MAGGGSWQTVNGAALPVIARNPPPEGAMIIPFGFILTPTNYAQQNTISLGAQSVSQVRTLFVDNSSNTLPLTVIHGIGLMRTIVPAGGGALIATASSQGSYFWTIATTNAPPSTTSVEMALYNYEIPPALWGTQIVTITTSVQIGIIAMWSGSAASIPVGWGLCDGTVYTRSDGTGTITAPNLVGQFILGANAATQGSSGGSYTITQANLPSYNLPVTEAAHNHAPFGGTFINGGLASGYAGLTIGSGTYQFIGAYSATASAKTNLTVASGGSGAAYQQPYYALCFIIKY